MIACDEDALICDMAETYQIYDMYALPVERLAIFSIGLRDNSRIKMKLAKTPLPIETMLSMSVVDKLNLLIWQNTADGKKGRNKPKSILQNFLEPKQNVRSFRTIEEFEAERARIING